jgi:hypothetical protein
MWSELYDNHKNKHVLDHVDIFTGYCQTISLKIGL